ncbi:MAG TPA: (d)CMP kinase [Clostridia bacterium]|nr:(d)CMP kinase [Clostridia bacterium]
MIIAIDGPAASGKSSVAKELAKRLGYLYIDTGAMFRAVTFYALEQGLDEEDQLKTRLDKLHLKSIPGGIEIDGRKLYDELRSKDVDLNVSYYSTMASIRSFLKDIQRQEARRHNVIMDGRDIGTAVFPQAQVKIFLSASAEKRAERRFKQRSNSLSYAQILEDIKRRDKIDSSRNVAPLKQAKDAIFIDSSNLSLEEVINKIEGIVKNVSSNS